MVDDVYLICTSRENFRLHKLQIIYREELNIHKLEFIQAYNFLLSRFCSFLMHRRQIIVRVNDAFSDTINVYILINNKIPQFPLQYFEYFLQIF